MSLLIENKSDLPKVNQIPYMILLWLPIKKEAFYSQIDQSNIAQYLVGFIPKEPISNIKRLAKLNDPDALKKLADCLLFELKGEKFDKSCIKMYEQAAQLNQPEALTFLAREIYQSMPLETDWSLKYQPDIPAKLASKVDQNTLKLMWFLLEKAAVLNWVSPFFVQQYRQAAALKIWKLTDMVHDMMNRWKRNEAPERLEYVHASSCSNKECRLLLTVPIYAEPAELNKAYLSRAFCRRCLVQRYCSERCREIDWPRHKSACVLDPRADQPDAFRIALKTAMEHDFKSLVAVNLSSNLVNRYTHALDYKISIIKHRINFGSSVCELTPYQHECYTEILNSTKVEDSARLMLALAHLKLMPVDQKTCNSINKLTNKANRCFQKGHFVNAVRNLNHAISIYVANKPISKMENQDKAKLAKLYAKRAQSNLKLGKDKKSVATVQKAADDCIFLLESGIIDIDLIKSDEGLFTQLKQAYANAKEELIVLTREAAEAEAAGSETTAQRRNRKNREAERERFKMNKQHQEVDAYLTSELIESFQGDKQLAINAVNDDDECPCCLTGWTSFNDIKIVAVLPCNHAMCLQCLNNWQKGWIDSNAALPETEQSKYFQCPLCRLDLKDDLVQSIAYAFAKRRPGELLTEFRSQLPVTDDEQFTDLVVDLLNRNELSLDRTYDCLFNIVGLVEPRPDGSFNPADKQAFYEQARAPVKLLRTELNRMAEELRSIDTESEDGIRLEEKYRLKQDQLNVAMKNAARDIYERVNSKVGSNFEGCVDLHGLHVNEAKEVVVEYVVPVLKAIGRMMIVTGRGLHCSNLTSQLRIRVREYFESLNVECEDIPGNEGAFYVVKN